MSGEQTQIPWNSVIAFYPTDLEAKEECGDTIEDPTFPLQSLAGDHTEHPYNRLIYTEQPEAFVLPMKIKSVNSHSLARVREER